MGTGQCAHQHGDLLDVVLRLRVQRQAEHILELEGGDDDADASGEAQGHRVGHEGDQAPGAQQPEGDQDQAGQHGAEQQPADAELLGDGQQYHHEGGRGAGNVEARAAGEGDQRSGDQHRVEAVLGRHAHGDRERHGERDGDDANGQASVHVAAQGLAVVALP